MEHESRLKIAQINHILMVAQLCDHNGTSHLEKIWPNTDYDTTPHLQSQRHQPLFNRDARYQVSDKA